MTHVDPLSPTIFNVVVYAVVLHWKSLAAERAGGDSRNNNTAKPAGRMIRESDKRQRRTEEGHTRLKAKEYFFHAEGGMVASTDPGWLHSALNMPTLLFDQLGLKKIQENRGDGVPPMPEGQGTVRRSLYLADDTDRKDI